MMLDFRKWFTHLGLLYNLTDDVTLLCDLNMVPPLQIILNEQTSTDCDIVYCKSMEHYYLSSIQSVSFKNVKDLDFPDSILSF